MSTRSHAISVMDTCLNAVCPYFTMFPIEFPFNILRKAAKSNARVLDPFCGRGTTNFAARILGLKTAGIDASSVAVAATEAKLSTATPLEIIDTAKIILRRRTQSIEMPVGEFWSAAYDRKVLEKICLIRDSLIHGSIDEHLATALRGIMLGALHGPRGRTKQSYFSNQCPRTYGPKPNYAIKFWKERNLHPPQVDVLDVIANRAHKYYGSPAPRVAGTAILGDSRDPSTLLEARKAIGKFNWVITSPPYYGLRTYLPDQWIRNWFLGGPPVVDYTTEGQLSHSSRHEFIADLQTVWMNVGEQCQPGATMVIRFGSIGSRPIEYPRRLLRSSLEETGWVIGKIRNADNAARGKRQASTFLKNPKKPCTEIDMWAQWNP